MEECAGLETRHGLWVPTSSGSIAIHLLSIAGNASFWGCYGRRVAMTIVFSSVNLVDWAFPAAEGTLYSCMRRVVVYLWTLVGMVPFSAIRGARGHFSLVHLILAAKFMFGEAPCNSIQTNLGLWWFFIFRLFFPPLRLFASRLHFGVAGSLIIVMGHCGNYRFEVSCELACQRNQSASR